MTDPKYRTYCFLTNRCECRGANRVYSEEAKRCKRVNPCRANSTICGEHGKCHMTRVGFKCQCEEGFRQADEQSACRDIDECLEVMSDKTMRRNLATYSGGM